MTQRELEECIAKCAGTWPGYTGNNFYGVRHPDYKDEVIVCAPDHDSAMATAAKVWDRQWTSIKFYAYAIVRRIK